MTHAGNPPIKKLELNRKRAIGTHADTRGTIRVAYTMCDAPDQRSETHVPNNIYVFCFGARTAELDIAHTAHMYMQ